MNICVTGGAGFIGSHLVDRLLIDGHHVVVVDNLVTGCREFVHPKAKFVEMDIRDQGLADLFIQENIDYVFHEAAQTMVPASMEDPKYDCDVNLVGLLNVLEACHKSKVKKILMPSSAAVYGDCTDLPLKENRVGTPSSFYGLSKATGESYLALYSKTFNLPYICYRYANVYGPRQGNGGEGGVISIFCEKAVKGETLQVFGDGEQTRDFIYVQDVVEANIAGLEHENVQGVYNVSTGRGISVNGLIETLQKVSGTEQKVCYKEARVGDIKDSCLSTEKSAHDLHWKAAMDFTEGLAETYAYMKNAKK